MFVINNSEEPIVATAIHAGHEMSTFLKDRSALSESGRLYEEDPFTDELAELFPNNLVVRRSRFEVDLNRPVDKSVYLTPDDAWGLTLWEHPLPSYTINRLHQRHQDFYEHLGETMRSMTQRHPAVVILDIHSYNYRRGNSDAPAELNPDINMGTATMHDPEMWKSVIQCATDTLRQCHLNESTADVRENIKFKGGYMASWLHNTFPQQVCVLSLEYKKVFMNEHTGEKYPAVFGAISDNLLQLRTALLMLLNRQKGHEPCHNQSA